MWTPTVSEGHKLQVFENKMLRKVFRSEKDEVSHLFRISHNKELCDSYRSLGVVRVVK
jgi:hypothetical protein